MKMERIKTGVPGLDELTEGGIPKGSTILVSGGAGTGKTILCLSYIYYGAIEFNEPGIYITLEEGAENISWNMENFGWDIGALQEQGLINIHRVHLNPHENINSQVEQELKIIAELVKEMGAKRLVVDSTTAFGIWMEGKGLLRHTLFEFTSNLKELGCTTFLVAETKNEKNVFSAAGVEEFVADGVIALYFTPPNRSLFVRKMRGTNHSKSVHPIDITKEGLLIKAKDEIMWDAIK
jgi:KaiC/GvpD/RAD55 family RecA-like ATPase